MKSVNKAAIGILTTARAMVNDGWISGSWETGQKVCAFGALNKASQRATSSLLYTSGVKSPDPFKRAAGFLANAITGKLVHRSTSDVIVGFNDSEGTTKSLVLKAFDRALSNLNRRHPSRRPLSL